MFVWESDWRARLLNTTTRELAQARRKESIYKGQIAPIAICPKWTWEGKKGADDDDDEVPTVNTDDKKQ